MDCDAVRLLIEEGVEDPRLTAHLAECAACRAEAAFGRRVAAAVAAIPRTGAPAGFAARVMAEVHRSAPEPVGMAWIPRLALRGWEMGGLVALCLVMAALIPLVLDRWLLASRGYPWSLLPDLSSLPEAPRSWALELSRAWQSALAYRFPWGSVSWSWVCGAAAFAIALCLLLSWRPKGSRAHGVEDAHAW